MKFDITKVKTCLNAEDVKEGDRGFVADSLASLKLQVEGKNYKIEVIKDIRDNTHQCRFNVCEAFAYTLFYPYEPETRVKDSLSIMKWIIDHDYEVDEDGDWFDNENGMFFSPHMWQYCGKKPSENWAWHQDWLEEVEV
jgi:hypothetical protein